MHSPPLILAADDVADNLEILRLRLESQGYDVATASNGMEALQRVRELNPDLVLLDVMMPALDGIEVVRAMRANEASRSIPVILVTAKADIRDVVEGLDAGGDDYLTKPFEHAALLARVRSMLRQKQLHDRIDEQARELVELNRTLTQRVALQVEEIARMGRLRRFLPPQIADMVLSGGGEAMLETQRREVTVVSCDLRGFTSFSETAEPEEVMAILGHYHHNLGEVVFEHGGTLERIVGDGLLIIFNAPLEHRDHVRSAVRMALAMRERMAELSEGWRKRGHSLGFGVGIAQGFVTVGAIGFDERQDYAAIGTTTILACRLCDEANPGQILISQRVYGSLEGKLNVCSVEPLVLKGFQRPVPAFELLDWHDGN